jgi:hypothetical protein
MSVCVSGFFLIRPALHQDVEPGWGQGQPFSSGASHSTDGAAPTDPSTGLASSAATCAGSSETLLFIPGSPAPNHFTFFCMRATYAFQPSGLPIKQVVLNGRRKHLPVEVCLEQLLWPQEERARDACAELGHGHPRRDHPEKVEILQRFLLCRELHDRRVGPTCLGQTAHASSMSPRCSSSSRPSNRSSIAESPFIAPYE